MKFAKKIMLCAVILMAISISKVYAVTGTVTADGIRVRKEPSTESAIITVLNATAEVEILGETGDWYQILYDSVGGRYEGYMHKDYIKKDGETAVPQTSPSPEITTPTPETPNTEETPVVEETQTPEVVETPIEEEQKVDLLGEKQVNAKTKVYVLPVITSSVKEIINTSITVTVQEVAGNFVYIKYNNGYGWVRVSSLKTVEEENNETVTEKKGYVNITQAIVRSKPTTASEMVTSLNFNTEVTIIGEEGDFYKVRVNDQDCYMAKFLLSDTKQDTPNPITSRGLETRDIKKSQNSVEETKATQTTNNTVEEKAIKTETTTQKNVPQSSVGEKIAEMAKSYIGYKYVYGGSNPSTGFDCSGLVYYICGQLGYSVNRTADYQVNNGIEVDKSNLQPGDLVFFTNYKTYTEIGHVGIYIGDNKFVHASTATTGVIVSSLNEPEYVKRYVTARRIGV